MKILKGVFINLIVTTLFLNSCSHYVDNNEIAQIGRDLILLRELDSIALEHPNFAIPNVRNVGPSLFYTIKQTDTPIDKYQYLIKKGDAKVPIGDGTASYLLEIYDSEKKSSIYVRLKYSPNDSIYDILGYF